MASGFARAWAPKRLSPAALLAGLVSFGGACAPTPVADTDGGGGDDDPLQPDAGSGAEADAGPSRADAAVEPTGCDRVFSLPGYDAAASVWLTGSFVDWAGDPATGAIEMTHGTGEWSTSLHLEPGTYRYKFIVDGDAWVHDPANPNTEDDGFGGLNSLFECGGGGAGVCGDPAEFDWRDTVMYFALVDRFFDSDGRAQPVSGVSDGDARYASSGQYEGGDLAGVTAKLGYLRDLGVSAIWLSAPFDNRDTAGASIDRGDSHTYSGYHGYWPSPANVNYADPANPTPRPRVESRIGTEADLRGLVSGAHGTGMKVLFDYVMNHVDSQSGLFQAHPDWFVYADGGGFALCGPGNLWNDPYWGTRCAFTDYLPPFDFYKNEVRAWSVADALWWAREYQIDGYRLDAIKHVPRSWLTDLRSSLNRAMPDPAGGRFYLVGETFDYFDRDLLKSFVDPDSMLDGQFDFPLKRQVCEAVFDPNGGLDRLSGFMGGNDTYYNGNSATPALMTTWIGNHDIPRAIHFADWRFGNCTEGSHGGNSWASQSFAQPSDAEPYERLGLAFAVLMTNPGIPLIYYGDEIGLAGGGDPDNRRMMPWDDGQLRSEQLALRATVARLASLRGEYKVLGRGTRTTLHADRDTWVYRMGGCGDSMPPVIVAINRANQPRSAPVPAGNYQELMSQTSAQVGAAGFQLPARGIALFAPE